MNIDNLNKLIAHMEAQPPERINMGWAKVEEHLCGTCGCILGHMELVVGYKMWLYDTEEFFGIDWNGGIKQLTHPHGWKNERSGVFRYPAHRVIATLRRLRDTYLSTGQVVVDWGPEPGEELKPAWTAPQVAEVINPALPAELTCLLRNTVEA